MKESVSTRHRPASFTMHVSVAGRTVRLLALASRVQIPSWQCLYAIYQLTKSQEYGNFYPYLTTNFELPQGMLGEAKK